MIIDDISQSNLKQEILNIIGSVVSLNETKLFFFGSRVKGNNQKRSDIDVGIIAEKKLPAEKKLKIQESLEQIPTLYKIDFVDFNNVASGFKKEAMKNIEYIN